MDLKKYDKLRKKINTKDFEGNNKGLDKWLFIFSFIGNISSIFFAYFLVFPSLLKAITANFITGNIGTGIAFGLTLVFLSIFEIIKRYFIKNFSNDFVTNNRNISFKMVSWLLVSITVIILSFYLSISGSKNLASTSSLKNIVAKTEVVTEIDTLESVYYKRKLIYIEDNEALREVNRELRQTLAESPLNYVTARKEYQASIDKNTELIGENDMKIKAIDVELQKDINVLNVDLDVEKSGNENEDSKNIVLFAIIVCLNELIIIGGLYFREFFEYNLFLINQDRFEKMYQKKDRYRILTTFIYNNGKLTTGDSSVDDEDAASTTDEEMNAAFHQDLSNASHAAQQQRESSQRQCFVILFGMGSEETEGIYTLRTVEYEEGDMVNVDTVVAFATEVDAQRFATLLEASLRHHPAVYSTSWVDITEWCEENNARCRLEPSGSLLIPPESNVSVTDWERALALQRGEFSVLEKEPMISQSAMHSMDGIEEAIVDSAFDNHVDNVSNIVDSRLANSSLNSVKEELERILGNSSSSSF